MERDKIAQAYPMLRMMIASTGFKVNNALHLWKESVVVHGSYEIQIPDTSDSISYGIVLVLPDNYPKEPPLLFCNDPRLPIGNLDRHILTYGLACLGVHADIGMRWPPGSTLVDFLNDLVAPFLIWQAYYEEYGETPPWGERQHFEPGILEFYKELLDETEDELVMNFIRLLARKNTPKGHEPCPCGSGEKLRNCHKKLVLETRERLQWQYVLRDLKKLIKPKRSK
jgi:hypothetical protein